MSIKSRLQRLERSLGPRDQTDNDPRRPVQSLKC